MTEQDQADLDQADAMVREGKRRRSRVLARVRVRKMRDRRAARDATDAG